MRKTFIIDPSQIFRRSSCQELPRLFFIEISIEKILLKSFLSPTHNAELSHDESRQL